MERAHIIYRGRVQGVFFRKNCQKNAVALGLRGWVKNTMDGDVEEVVEGEGARIIQHLDWNRTKQPHARVTDHEIEWMPATGEFREFSIIG